MRLFLFTTVVLTVGRKRFLFCTVGRNYGRQFTSRFLNSRLSRRLETTVQEQERVSHTVVPEHDFSELTVEKGISF